MPDAPRRQLLGPTLARRLTLVLTTATLASILAVAALRSAWPGALTPVASIALAVLLMVSLGTLLAWREIDRLILRRLSGLNALLGQSDAKGGATVPQHTVDSDEIDALGARLQALLDETTTSRRGLDYVANHDGLTGVGNRRYLGERLAQALNHVRTHPHVPISLMLVDINGFKLINDGLGHAAGDAALCEVAKRLRALLRPEDALARLGGDEFAILLYDVRSHDAGEFFQKLLRAIGEPLRLERRSISLGVSCGIAEGLVGISAHDWQRRADLALRDAKREGMNRLAVFRDTLQSEAARELRLAQALRAAIAEDELEVWFQPVVDGGNGAVLGLEALSRWTFEGEPVPPLEFIGLAEQTGQIAALGRRVLQAACACLARLRLRHPALRCSVNLSVGQFTGGDIEADVLAAVSAAGLPLSALRLEITESLVAQHEAGIVPAMRRLVGSGAEFCLDDFGTGFSSLDRLRQLPIKALKIDRSFVVPLGHGDDVMVRHIVGLGRDLGLDTVAEGVEREEERSRLCAIGCAAMQGFLFARPMPEAELTAWLEHRVVKR